MQLVDKEFPDFLDKPPAVLGRAADEAVDFFDEDHPHGEDGTEEVGPNLIRQIANLEAVHVKEAFARWKVSRSH